MSSATMIARIARKPLNVAQMTSAKSFIKTCL